MSVLERIERIRAKREQEKGNGEGKILSLANKDFEWLQWDQGVFNQEVFSKWVSNDEF